MRSAIAIGIEASFDTRIERCDDELKACLGLAETKSRSSFLLPAPTRSFKRCSVRALLGLH